MVKKSKPSMKSRLFVAPLMVMLLLGSTRSKAQRTDTTKKPLLASLKKKSGKEYIVRPANVEFPEILKGNEEKTLDYIERFSESRRAYILRMHAKGRKLLPQAATIFQKYDLPTELTVLLTLESAYNANAVSKAGAVGYWQIMDEVAKEYGMRYVAQLSMAEKRKVLKAANKKKQKKGQKINRVDDRKNFKIATHTAGRYLRDRRRNLDDNWLLVVASYNCGIGNVWQAMKRSGKTNPDFWDIKKYLPAETQSYVMNFITLNVLFHNYELFAKNQLNFKPEKIIIPANLDEVSTETAEEFIGPDPR
jgi:Soluble lytic murein transglycosylase and related regulatory proteins (some contain LysM/invasin domains)